MELGECIGLDMQDTHLYKAYNYNNSCLLQSLLLGFFTAALREHRQWHSLAKTAVDTSIISDTISDDDHLNGDDGRSKSFKILFTASLTASSKEGQSEPAK